LSVNFPPSYSESGSLARCRLSRGIMARLEDLKFTYRLFMRGYQFRCMDWSPGAHLGKPLAQAKFALVTTAALHLPQQAAFDHSIRGGDCSFRELPGNVDVRNLKIAHRSSAFDQSGARKDRNLVFPLDRELVREKKLGALNHRHFSFMGSITAPARLISETAPAVAKLLQQDQVDAAFLVPV
jgi:D-proline reductase (dithiol) PrdB